MSDEAQNSLIPYMVVGLGNPGQQYKTSRHNMGFLTLDHLAHHLNLSFSRVESKALVCKGEYKTTRLFLVKPQTYMNLSGLAVGSLLRFYHIPLSNLLIAYDDIDLPFGILRIRPSGGSAGHKGMQSIIDRLGTNEIARLRLGVNRPEGRKTAASYVLKKFSASELEILPLILNKATQAILTVLENGLESAMNQFNNKNEE
ncbi:MAG: aminoacyl-tRNA hydrolase [Chloroflexi bacterium]|nr:aminoacyl-tRNA hydrolase [Chloroflexota bacterium]